MRRTGAHSGIIAGLSSGKREVPRWKAVFVSPERHCAAINEKQHGAIENERVLVRVGVKRGHS